jgi:glutamate racemase
MNPSASKSPTIGVFDSGFGGLTVLRALLPLIPAAHYVYLGDTARLPYGSKSRETIARYAVESARFLADHGAELLVIACNTATALAMPEIRAAVSIPVIGVIEPAVEMAHCGKQHGEVLVLATQATTQSHAYFEACARRDLRAVEKACPLLVPLVEEGWIDHPVTRDVLRIYLSEALQDCAPSAVLLGCTHYPLISGAIEQTLRLLGSQATIIDSAHSTARMTAMHFGQTSVGAVTTANATFECYATDSVEKFARLGSQFLGQPIPHVHLLDLGG